MPHILLRRSKKDSAPDGFILTASAQVRIPGFCRGLGDALKRHDTDNAPHGTTNGSANCIADSWRLLKGLSYALVFLLSVDGSMYSFTLRRIRYPVFFQLPFDVFLYLLFAPSYCIDVVSPWPRGIGTGSGKRRVSHTGSFLMQIQKNCRRSRTNPLTSGRSGTNYAPFVGWYATFF